jgi:hypothetical protein
VPATTTKKSHDEAGNHGLPKILLCTVIGPTALSTTTAQNDIVHKLGSIVEVRSNADPFEEVGIFRQLGLKLTYHPDRQLVPDGLKVVRRLKAWRGDQSEALPWVVQCVATSVLA